MNSGKDMRDLSMGELLKQLSTDTATLVRQEIALARAEVAARVNAVTASAGLLGAAILLAFGAFGAFTATLILVLALVMPVWAAALIVTVVYAVAAAVSALTGKKKITAAMPPAPETARTLKEDVEWAKTQAKSVRR